MKVKAVIEIPRGDNRRRHLNFSRTEFIDLGPIADKIPVNDGVLLTDYGFIPDTINSDGRDEIDILIVGGDKLKVGQEVLVSPVATLQRADGDSKVIATYDESRWEDIGQDIKKWLYDFCGYHTAITGLLNKEETEKFISQSQQKQIYKYK